jgi:hypothetical protein
MKRAVVCVATTERYQRGMARLFRTLPRFMNPHYSPYAFDHILVDWPSHEAKPYAFKAYALKQAADEGADLVLWCDACILPIRSLEPLWEKIEREGYWICNNGWLNSQWCADNWYADCYPGVNLEDARAENRNVPHVVATCFGLNLQHPVGKSILQDYYKLASKTRAFCGPWKNTPETPCGPPEVLGHRHDQSCLSILAYRAECQLTDPPATFAYKGGETEKTIVIADGSYT